ncbi:beta-microseminoprotein-like [Xenopus laevis]|uniref:Beta-microseminoprotein-like n=2 Tax=Xenopus laevis TaxID=8355 RepID=A0A8J1L5D3_XENLA|nr:beta-microseminoprotein-like [Xenopus laevis]
MKCVLAFVIAVGILLTTCNAACFNQQPDGNQKGCLYKGKMHRLGSTFRTKDCMECTCDMDGSLRCCDISGRPVEYDEKKCEVLFDKKTCMYRVVEKKDHSKECKHSMVG